MSEKPKFSKRFEHWLIMALLLAVFDVIAVNFSYFLALWFRFDCMYSEIPWNEYMVPFLKFAPIYALVCLFVFWRFRLYNSIWRFASVTEMTRVTLATTVTSVVHIFGITFLFNRMPISYYIIGMGIQFLLVLGARFSYRFILLEKNKIQRGSNVERAMLIGAGNAGQGILRDVARMQGEKIKVCCIIDDNPNKWGRYIDGIPVVGGRDDILANVEKYTIKKILIAIPSASAEDKRDILNICKETGCEMKNLPGVYQLLSGRVTMASMKDVAVEDLLGREPVKVNMSEIYREIQGKTILVTGGGGSIGSELCRQVAAHNPRQLIIFDIYENNAYDIEQELRREYPGLKLEVLIGSVRDSRRINSVFAEYKPDMVYHAAAHKHVPLMEGSPCEAIKNNVIGTYKTAYAALIHGCKRFVLISTDKAVNPTNIMGASKRLCEMVIQSFDRAVKTGCAKNLPMLFTHREDGQEIGSEENKRAFCTEFVAVRFGNVLGSNGSVIPLFKKQIENGGPVTVTHPDIIRYFMTIPEAVSLVMQAGAYASGGEIFVLDMGQPVKIDELARNLIKLSGLKPDVDIQIQYTGLRPGEKLYEEKLMAEEGMQRTDNELIHIGNPIPFDTDVFLVQLQQLMTAAYENNCDISKIVEQMVSTYHPEAACSGEKDQKYKEIFTKPELVKI